MAVISKNQDIARRYLLKKSSINYFSKLGKNTLLIIFSYLDNSDILKTRLFSKFWASFFKNAYDFNLSYYNSLLMAEFENIKISNDMKEKFDKILLWKEKIFYLGIGSSHKILEPTIAEVIRANLSVQIIF